jgi:hypothetical protein
VAEGRAMTHAAWVWLLTAVLLGCDRVNGEVVWNWPALTFLMTTLCAVGLGIGLLRGENYMRRQERRTDRQDRRDERL